MSLLQHIKYYCFTHKEWFCNNSHLDKHKNKSWVAVDSEVKNCLHLRYICPFCDECPARFECWTTKFKWE